MTQQEVLNILKMGRNVFLTGSPGSGKTHTINEYVSYLRSCKIEPAITASTGISATHIGGMTIHSWSGIGIKDALDKYILKKIADGYAAKRIKRTKVLIIDEVSMLSPKTFTVVDQVCREIKKSSKPFGGMQVVAVGDFFQLPPIVKMEENAETQMDLLGESSGRFAYESSAWQKANFTVCYLTEQHRQDDGDFLSVLAAIRRNEFSDAHLQRISTRKILHQLAPKTAPKLFSHNIDVDRVNNQILGTLPGDSKVFNMYSFGPEPLVAALKRGCLSPDALSLKIGAQVMFTKNNQKEGFVNGTLGVVKAFMQHTSEPLVKTRDGKSITVSAMDWTVEENGKARATISQLPLRLAWAITVHKSQGMSLDEAVMDLGNVFEYGQGYVALSRVRRLSGLHLLGWNEHAFKVHPDVLEKDGEFQKQSEQALLVLSTIGKNDIKKISEQFIIDCGGNLPLTKQPLSFGTTGVLIEPEALRAEWPAGPTDELVSGKNITQEISGAYSVKKIREKHKSAYMPWDKAHDIELQELFTKGLSIAELTTAFNRTRGSINARLKKLGILEG